MQSRGGNPDRSTSCMSRGSLTQCRYSSKGFFAGAASEPIADSPSAAANDNCSVVIAPSVKRARSRSDAGGRSTCNSEKSGHSAQRRLTSTASNSSGVEGKRCSGIVAPGRWQRQTRLSGWRTRRTTRNSMNGDMAAYRACDRAGSAENGAQNIPARVQPRTLLACQLVAHASADPDAGKYENEHQHFNQCDASGTTRQLRSHVRC